MSVGRKGEREEEKQPHREGGTRERRVRERERGEEAVEALRGSDGPTVCE